MVLGSVKHISKAKKAQRTYHGKPLSAADKAALGMVPLSKMLSIVKKYTTKPRMMGGGGPNPWTSPHAKKK